MDGAFPSKECLERAYDSMFEPNPWYYELRKEVRKRMAIDYKEEWETLQHIYGKYAIQDERKIPSIPTSLNEVMNFQIQHTIQAREKLMEEFVKSRMKTDITSSSKYMYTVGVIFRGNIIAYVKVDKDAFQSWLKNRKEVK